MVKRIVSGAAFAAPGAIALPPRALWVWNTDALYENAAAQAAFFAFVTAPHGKAERAIGRFYVNGLSLENLAAEKRRRSVRAFLREAHRRGRTIEFLCGDAEWARAERHDEGLAYLKAILSFNQMASRPDERFDGFQYDVEPYSLPGWPDASLRREFLQFFDKSRQLRDVSRQSLTLGAAIPRWFDDPKLNHLDREILERLDYTVLMDYVDNADSLIADARNEIEYARKIGKKVWIGVETQKLPDEPKSTFFAAGNAAMEAALTQAASVYRDHSGFGGFALHHWESYRLLRP